MKFQKIACKTNENIFSDINSNLHESNFFLNFVLKNLNNFVILLNMQ